MLPMKIRIVEYVTLEYGFYAGLCLFETAYWTDP